MAMSRHSGHSIVLAALLAGGCASTPEVRNLAARTGVFVTSMQGGTSDFIAAQNRLNAGNEVQLRTLERRAETLRARVGRQRIASTRAGATDLLRTQEAATATTGAEVIARLHPRLTEPATVSFDGDEGYGKAAQGLVEVGAKPSTLALLRSLVTYSGAVRDAHSELVEKAKKSATESAAETADAATDALAEGAAAVPE
jgi:hypothetical protein